MKSVNVEKSPPMSGLLSLWGMILASVMAYAYLGVFRWPELRETVPAPGLAAGMGLVGTVGCALSIVAYIVVRLVFKKSPVGKRIAWWILAETVALIALAFYSLPNFPGWLFGGLIVCAVGLLLFTNPWRKLPASK
ncbi:MAG: hypothetical protein P9L99_10020 [Candidatus Lernaella stagnicola]|nr:hypothetical protein [Candidatus Lernaella stagnicola]